MTSNSRARQASSASLSGPIGMQMAIRLNISILYYHAYARAIYYGVLLGSYMVCCWVVNWGAIPSAGMAFACMSVGDKAVRVAKHC